MRAVFAPSGSLFYAGLRVLLTSLERASPLSSVMVDLSRLEFASPGAMVPLAAIVFQLRSEGVVVDARMPSTPMAEDYFAKAGWTSAILGDDAPPRPSHRRSFVPIIRFSDHTALNAAVSATLEVVSAYAVYPTGVLKAIEWALNEVADNVLVHAGSDVHGWMQVIATPRQGRLSFTVADHGRGILASLRERYTDLAGDQLALEKAILPGVTRDSRVGQGNGLSGSVRIAEAMHGWVNLLSGRGELRVMDDGRTHTQASPSYSGTVVDVTLPSGTEVDIAEALWGHEPSSSLELSHLVGGSIVFRVRDESPGFGNRASGLEVSNKLANVLNDMPGERVTVDFESVEFVSASFADEFLAKLIKRYGVGTFLARVGLTNMSSLVGRTVNAVVAQRMASDG
ncbi:MAG: ATP-binding protein [Candidatus Limnocylindrales bacterium]